MKQYNNTIQRYNFSAGNETNSANAIKSTYLHPVPILCPYLYTNINNENSLTNLINTDSI